ARSILAASAEAKTSARAPPASWSTKPEEPPNDRSDFPSSSSAETSARDAAAKTVAPPASLAQAASVLTPAERLTAAPIFQSRLPISAPAGLQIFAHLCKARRWHAASRKRRAEALRC